MKQLAGELQGGGTIAVVVDMHVEGVHFRQENESRQNELDTAFLCSSMNTRPA